MITNLVMNSLLHAFVEQSQGEIRIVVRSVLESEQETDMLELSLSDNGKGIAPENLAKIFDPFFTTMRGRGGSGLGLNIVHNLVTGTLQGQISVESQLDVGTTFLVRFPRSPVDAVRETSKGETGKDGAAHV